MVNLLAQDDNYALVCLSMSYLPLCNMLLDLNGSLMLTFMTLNFAVLGGPFMAPVI